jgi:hypothetical protein
MGRPARATMPVMRVLAIVLSAVLLTHPCFCASPGRSEGPAEGLLLGFSTTHADPDNHNRAQELSTAWIVRHGNTAQLVAVLPYLVVPRATAFWRVGIERVCEMYGESNEFRATRDIVWSGPVDAVSQLSKGPDCPSKPPSERETTPSDQPGDGQLDKYTDCMYSDRSISFVSPNYISESAREGNTEACEARGNRWSAWSRVVSITTPEIKETHGFTENGGVPRTYGPVARAFTDGFEEDPKQALSAFEKTYTDEVKGLRDGGLNCDEGQPDYLGWQIKRKDATWMPVISQQLVLGFGGCEIEEYVPITLPASFVGGNQLVPSLAALKKSIADLTDAFSSPQGDTIIALTSAKAIVFNVTGAKLGAKLLEADFPNGAVSVMVQWAVGTHVEDWTRQVQQWQAYPPAAPVISVRSDK